MWAAEVNRMRLAHAEPDSQLCAWGGSRAQSVGCVCVPTPPAASWRALVLVPSWP